MKIILKLEKGEVPDRNAKGWKADGKSEESHGRSARGGMSNWKMEAFMGEKRCGTAPKRESWKTGERCLGRKAIQSDSTQP